MLASSKAALAPYIQRMLWRIPPGCAEAFVGSMPQSDGQRLALARELRSANPAMNRRRVPINPRAVIALSSEDMWHPAVEIGEKNQRTLTLVKNWCAHARIEKMGGVGIVEQVTGHPLGLHAVICDFAPTGGIYTWDLVDAALDFHDRHCATCIHRKPVGLPNLSALLAERNSAQRSTTEHQRSRDAAQRDARAARQAVRDGLRSTLDTESASVVDQLSALDGAADTQIAYALVATAKLAPEAFPPALVGHLFALLETSQDWVGDVALQILLELKTDPVPLAQFAMLALAQHLSREAAVQVVLATLDHVDVVLVEGALPELIELAEPLDLPFMHGDRQGEPAGLLALHRRWPSEVERVVGDLLVRTDFDGASLGARGAAILAKNDASAAQRLARGAVSALTRSKALNDRSSGIGQALHALREAVAEAYRADPETTESLMQSFLPGTTEESQARLFSVYRKVLRSAWDEMAGSPTPAQDAVMRRLIRAVTEPHPDEVQREVQGIFQGSARELKPLAARHIDGLLGAALVLDDRIQRLEAEEKQPAASLFDALERRNRRDGASALQKNLVSWAAEAAAGNIAATTQYLALRENLPDDRDRLRAVMVGGFKRLAASSETFSVILPPLYGALIGASVLVRGAITHPLAMSVDL